MTVKKSIGAYADCLQVMDAALQRGELRVPFPTRGQAINFRQRCYRVRQALLQADNPPPGSLPQSRYDSIVITIPDKGDVGDDTLRFRSRKADADNILSRAIDAEGNPVAIEPAEDLDAEAQALRGRLGLE